MPRTWVVAAALVLIACTGSVEQGAGFDRPGVATPSGPGAAAGTGGGGSMPGSGHAPPAVTGPGGFIGDGPADGAVDGCSAGALEPGTRLPRLTHAQYDNSVRDLLGIDVSPSQAFLGDPTFSGFDNSTEGLAIADRLGRDYRRAAEQLAAQAVADSAAYRQLVPCDTQRDAAACARTFVERFLQRAYRRPPSSAEVQSHLALHALGPELGDTAEAFAAGVQLVIEAALQSPSFLYRVELSTQTDGAGYVELNDYEIASRLSYALWNTMPDDALMQLAAAGELHTPEQVAEQARRMLDDVRAERTVADFHRQWLELSAYEDLLRDPAQFPLFSPELASALQAETLEFVRHVTFDLEEGLGTLLTAPFSFVNEDTAPLYGLSGDYGPDLTRAELDPSQRAGLLTQLGFLASHAFYAISSPIHRGVFVHRKVMCTALPDPPGNADLVLPPIEGEIKTTRQQVEVHTSPDACRSCHGVINPAGFAFERYDAVGQFRTLDHGERVDSAAELAIDGQAVRYADAVEFTRALAESEDVRSCYATQWLRYLYGRQDSAADRCTIATIARVMSDPAYSTKDMLADLTRTRAFLQRAQEQTP